MFLPCSASMCHPDLFKIKDLAASSNVHDVLVCRRKLRFFSAFCTVLALTQGDSLMLKLIIGVLASLWVGSVFLLGVGKLLASAVT